MRIATALFLAVVLMLVLPVPAVAGEQAIAKRSVGTTAARWAVAPAALGTAPTAGTYEIHWAVSQGTAYHYFDLVNLGSANLSGYTFRTTNALKNTGGQKAPVVVFDVCRGGSWNRDSSACSGTVVTLGTTTTAVFTTTMAPIPSAGRLSVRASTRPSTQNAALTTIDLLVSRAEVRSASTRNE